MYQIPRVNIVIIRRKIEWHYIIISGTNETRLKLNTKAKMWKNYNCKVVVKNGIIMFIIINYGQARQLDKLLRVSNTDG